MSATSHEEGTLSRETNWWGAFVIGLAGTILIIGLVGFALVALGGAAIPLFAILTAVGVVLCFCLAELAAMMPERAGGLPVLRLRDVPPARRELCGKHMGGLSSWAYWLGWFTVAPINAILAANYIIALFSIKAGSSHTFGPISNGFGAQVSITQLIVGAAILLVMFVPCLLGIRLGATFATVLGVASMIPLVLLVLLPFVKPSKIDFGRLDGFGLPAGVTRELAADHRLGVHLHLVGARDGGGRLLHRRVPRSGARRQDRDDGRGPVRLLHLRLDPGHGARRARHRR